MHDAAAQDRGSTGTHRSTISNTHVPIWRVITWNQVNNDELSAPDYHDRRCIYCCGPVAVWMLLYGHLQHRERRECQWCRYGVRVLFSMSSYCYIHSGRRRILTTVLHEANKGPARSRQWDTTGNQTAQTARDIPGPEEATQDVDDANDVVKHSVKAVQEIIE